MKQFSLVALAVVALFGALALPAGSQSPDTLDTFVTPEFISVTITGGPIEYGSVPLSSADDSRSTKAGGPVLVSNTGSVEVDFRIHGSDATSGVAQNATWTLDCTGQHGEVGTNQFVHKFAKADSLEGFDFGNANSLCPMPANAKAFAQDVEPQGAVGLILQIAMPTSSTGFAQRTSPVIVTGILSP